MPIFWAILCTFLALVPVACISATAAIRALSALWWRVRRSSGKKLPCRGFGTLSVSVPTHVAGLRSL